MNPRLIALSVVGSGHITNPPSRSTNAPNRSGLKAWQQNSMLFGPAPTRVLSLFLRLKLFDWSYSSA